MSDMKCPFCQQAIVCTDKRDADEYATWFCPRCVAERKWCAFGNKTFWQELIRTRKALDVLLLTINRLENQNYKDCAWHLRLAIAKIKATGIANKALEQITALEQKDVK